MTPGAAGVPTADPTPYRFRRLLALYPARWQAEHGEAYLGVMLDLAEADGRTRPAARERVSLLRHLAGVWRAELARRAAADRGLASLRWLGGSALVSGTILAVLCAVLGEWGPLPTGRARHWQYGVVSTDHRVGLLTAGIVLYALWGLAFGLAVTGRGRAARRVLLACAVTPVALVALAASTSAERPRLVQLVPFTVFAVAASISWPTAPSRRTRLVVSGAVGGLGALGIASVLTAVLRLPSDGWPESLLGRGFYGGTSMSLLGAPVVAAVLAGFVIGLLTVVRRPGLLLTSLVVGVPWLLLVQASILPSDYATRWWLVWESRSGLGILAIALAALLTASAGSAALRAARAG